MKCKDCNHCYLNKNDKTKFYGCCMLTHVVVNPEADINCNLFNKDLSEYDICYNCEFYGGGSDWGLFCSKEENYHHLGNFNDAPCEYYVKRKDKK